MIAAMASSISRSRRRSVDVEQQAPTAYAAEFIGTFLLVAFIGLILSVQSPGGLGYREFAVVGLLHAFVLTMLIATLGGASGAHFNPAVTITLAALRKISPVDAAVYIAVQLAGAVAAALVVKAMLIDPADAVNYGATGVNDKFVSGNGGAFVAELLGTFVLMWAIMGMAVNPRGDRNWAPYVIGATLGFAVMAVGPITGAGLNPARAFGPALVSGEFGGAGSFLFVYVLGPIVGALLAGVAYSAIVLRPQGFGEGVRPIDKLD